MYTITIHVGQDELNELLPYLLNRYGGPVEVGGTFDLMEEEARRRIDHYGRMTEPIAVGEIDMPYSEMRAYRSGPAWDAYIDRRNHRRAARQRHEYPLTMNQACTTCPAGVDEPCTQGDGSVAAHPHKARQA